MGSTEEGSLPTPPTAPPIMAPRGGAEDGPWLAGLFDGFWAASVVCDPGLVVIGSRVVTVTPLPKAE